MRDTKQKVVPLEKLSRTVETLRKKKKKIVLCHGVFDLLHPGHILYFQAAKKHGDVLIVTITADQYINKGPGRPVFNQQLRMESIASLECVDFVTMSNYPTAVEIIRSLKPHIYAKGQDYANAASDITGQIRNEMAAVKKNGGRTIFTNEQMFSSSSLLNKFYNPYPSDTTKYLKNFRQKYSIDDILGYLKKLSNLKVLVIGESILDQYSYCHPMAKSPKETIVASRFISEENFAGGTLAIANHLANFCKQVTLVSTIGSEPKVGNFFRRKLHKKIEFQCFVDSDRPTITKKRFAEANFLTKMFEIQYIDDTPLPPSLERKISETLRKLLPKYDMVIVADYGHGLFTEKLREEIRSLSPFLCVNTQTNSANYGFNVATKYNGVDFVAIDEPEMKLALRARFGDPNELAVQLHRDIKSNVLLVSRGPKGSVIIGKDEKRIPSPVLSTKVIDRTGAGDALFALTAPLVYQKTPLDVVGFVGNCVGAMAVEIVCNREAISMVNLSKFVTGVLK